MLRQNQEQWSRFGRRGPPRSATIWRISSTTTCRSRWWTMPNWARHPACTATLHPSSHRDRAWRTTLARNRGDIPLSRDSTPSQPIGCSTMTPRRACEWRTCPTIISSNSLRRRQRTRRRCTPAPCPAAMTWERPTSMLRSTTCGWISTSRRGSLKTLMFKCRTRFSVTSPPCRSTTSLRQTSPKLKCIHESWFERGTGYVGPSHGITKDVPSRNSIRFYTTDKYWYYAGLEVRRPRNSSIFELLLHTTPEQLFREIAGNIRSSVFTSTTDTYDCFAGL